MLNFIKTALQTILDTLETNITHVVVQDMNSLEKGLPRKEENLLQVVYRENDTPPTTIKSKDRYVSGTLTMFALENEKANIKEMWEQFITAYNQSFQTDRFIYAGQIQAVGAADNVGSKIYQTWVVTFDVLIVDSIGTLKDITITIDGKTIGAETGLLSCINTWGWATAEAPTSQYMQLKRRYITRQVEINVLDMANDFTDLLENYLFDDLPKASVTITKRQKITTFEAELTITHSAQQKAFNSYTVIIRRG